MRYWYIICLQYKTSYDESVNIFINIFLVYHGRSVEFDKIDIIIKWTVSGHYLDAIYELALCGKGGLLMLCECTTWFVFDRENVSVFQH